MVQAQIDLPMDKIADFCRHWKITEFALFGSVLRDDFRPDSDIDVLVTFEAGTQRGIFEFAAIERELADLLARPVDLTTRRAIEEGENPYRKKDILESAQTIYAA